MDNRPTTSLRLTSLPREVLCIIIQYISDPSPLSRACRLFRCTVPGDCAVQRIKQHGKEDCIFRCVAAGLRDSLFFRCMVIRGCVPTLKALVCAVDHNEPRLVGFLIRSGAPVNVTSFAGDWPFSVSPLGRSVGRPRVMSVLLGAGATFPTGSAYPVFARLIREKRTAELRLLQNACQIRHLWGAAAGRYIGRVNRAWSGRPGSMA